MNNDVIRSAVHKIGKNRDKPRIWIEGKYLEQAGFPKGTIIKVNFEPNKIIITPGEGDNTVSGKKDKYPIIDINSKKIAEAFDVERQVRITVWYHRIEITKTFLDTKKDTRPKDRSMMSVFTGVGCLDEAAKKEGYKPKVAIEINQKYADIYQNNNPDVTVYNCDVAEINTMNLPRVELVVGGIPCEAFSKIRRNYREQCSLPEEHETADLSIYFVEQMKHVNPRAIILEEVPQYLKSGIGIATMAALRRLGYYVISDIVDGTDYGEPTQRKRAVILATTEPMKFPTPNKNTRKLSDILLPVDHPECKWWDRSTKAWVIEHWEKQTAKGNNFASQVLEYGKSETVQAITRRYFAQQAGNPVVKHPYLEGTYRWLTLSEVKEIMGMDADYDLGSSVTYAGEGLGQGVLVNVFRQIIRSLKNG